MVARHHALGGFRDIVLHCNVRSGYPAAQRPFRPDKPSHLPMKPVLFEPYGRQRRARRMPRWLVLLIAGAAAGAGSVLVVQERFLPPRLSAQATSELRSAYEQADQERQQLRKQLADTTQRLEAAVADKARLSTELGASRATVQDLHEDVAALVEVLPADPRGGPVQVRAARFTSGSGRLQYDVVLSRERAAGGKSLQGVLQFVVAGEPGRGTPASIVTDPIAISLGRYESVRGNVTLPESFRPRQTTVNVLDRAGGKLLGRRVLNVK